MRESEQEQITRELINSVQSFLSAKCNLRVVRDIADGNTDSYASLWTEISELGWNGINIPEEFGGLGLDLPILAALYRELGSCLSPFPIMPSALAAQVLKTLGTEQLKKKYLPELAAGGFVATVGMPIEGSQLQVDDVKGQVILNGSVHSLLATEQVRLIFVPLRDKSGRTAYVVLDEEHDSFAVMHRQSMDLTRKLFYIEFDHFEVHPNSLLVSTKEFDEELHNHACIGLACDSVGGTTHILSQTVEYLNIREQFGRPIGSFQALKHRAANWKILQEAASALAGQSAYSTMEPCHKSSVWASNAKHYVCDTYAAIAGDAIQLHGGIGFTWEHDCHLFFKRAKLNQALFGDSSYHKDRAAKHLFG